VALVTGDRPSPTLTGLAGGQWTINDTGRLAVRDGLILQSFPEDWPVQGSKASQWRQIGNAVPPRLAASVLAAVTGSG
jgi:DNA (cytosine-5)-methyltransferase 1